MLIWVRPLQRVGALVGLAVQRDVGLGEVEDRLDVGAGERLDAEEVAMREQGGPPVWRGIYSRRATGHKPRSIAVAGPCGESKFRRVPLVAGTRALVRRGRTAALVRTISRRSLHDQPSLAPGRGAVPFLPLAGFAPARAEGGPSFRFGIVADPQYAAVPPVGTRHYAASLGKLSEAVAAFNAEDLAFVATLGDIVDRGRESYDDILPLYRRLVAPCHFVLGNHDGAASDDYLGLVEEVTGRRRGYYDYAARGYRFLVIDGNEVSTFAHAPGSEAHALAVERLRRMKEAGAVNTSPVSGGLSDAQFAWIEARMEAARAALASG